MGDSHRRRHLTPLLLGLGLLLGILLLAGCGPYLLPVPLSEQPGAATPDQPTQRVIIDPGQLSIDQRWQASAHGNSYVTTPDGINNACADCHAPWEYTPTTSAELPKDCLSCKFTLPDPEPISEADWKSIPCNVCHKVSDGAAEPGIYMVNAIIIDFSSDDPYQPMASDTELCQQCHRDEGDFLYARDLGSQLHQDFECTACHDPHYLKADCTTCHQGELTAAESNQMAHGADHQNVSCAACHDAAGFEVKPDTDGNWQPVRVTPQFGDQPYASHNLQKSVDCGRCHSAGNPWGLKVY